MNLETGLIIIGCALLLLVLLCIPILLKLWRAASDIAITLQTLNQRLPEILKNMEEISANINRSTTAINEQVQNYSVTAQRFNRIMNGIAGGMELLSPLALKAPVFRKFANVVALIKGLGVFWNVLTSRQKGS